MAAPLYVNRKIEKENFVFDDKGGKFFMYADVCARHADEYQKVEIWSEDGPEGNPAVLKVSITQRKDDRYIKYSTIGARAYVKMDYSKVQANDLFYVIENLINMSGGKRLRNRIPGETIYMVRWNSGHYRYVTKEKFDDPKFDFNND